MPPLRICCFKSLQSREPPGSPEVRLGAETPEAARGSKKKPDNSLQCALPNKYQNQNFSVTFRNWDEIADGVKSS